MKSARLFYFDQIASTKSREIQSSRFCERTARANRKSENRLGHFIGTRIACTNQKKVKDILSMTIRIFNEDKDSVIESWVLTGMCDYKFALQALYPLIDKFEAQRKIQNPAFYERLRRDILAGCIMPPITLALVADTDKFKPGDDFEKFINDNVSYGYVLDGMQRLHNLHIVSTDKRFDPYKNLYLSVVIAKNKDMLLYRMITLNNGQRPMSPRHQIEVLTQELFDFTELNISVQTEKERSERIVRGSFNLSDISKGYLAFITDSLHNDNSRIIAEKMDELIISKILHAGPSEGLEFQSVLSLIDRLAQDQSAKVWLQTQNNLIGFCVGIKDGYTFLKDTPEASFGTWCVNFDESFKAINAAKVNLGKYRRELSAKFIKGIERYATYDVPRLIEFFNDETAI